MRIGTRESRLAMRQTEIFCERMNRANPGIELEVVGMKALGDIDLASPLNKMAEIGAFVRELDDAMEKGLIDASVNSLKDIPTQLDDRLTIASVLPRDSDEDVILPCPLDDLPVGAKIGTSSVRRKHMLREARPDIQVVPLRGNIHTRLQKLDDGEYDAIVLAKAGLDRMGITRPMSVMDKDRFIPAPAQGAIAVECRKDDKEACDALKKLDDWDTRMEVGAERGIMRLMGAGCSAPVGINAESDGCELHIRAVSYGYTEDPRRVDTSIPVDYVFDEILGIAEYLTGKRDVII